MQQHTFTNAQRIEDDTRRETELQSTLIKLGESEKRCEELQKQNNKLSDEAECAAQQLESHMEETQAEINQLDNMLSAALDQNAKITAEKDAKAQEEQKKNEKQMAEQKQQYNEMEQKLSDEKEELAQQFETYREIQQVIIINVCCLYLNNYKPSLICRRIWLNFKICCSRR